MKWGGNIFRNYDIIMKDKHLKEIYRNSLKLTTELRKEVDKLQQDNPDNEYLPLEKWIDKFNEQLAEIVLIKMSIENELKSGNYSQKKEKENEKI